MHHYFLVQNGQRVFLYTDTSPYRSEAECLNQYEKGLASGQYSFNRSKINQVWSELAIWILIGRVYPVELLRVLCANGANIEVGCNGEILQKSYTPVKYSIPMQKHEYQIIKPTLEMSLGFETNINLNFFSWSEDKLNLGVFYSSVKKSADSDFPRYCNMLEHEMLLPAKEVHRIISRLFNLGFKITAEHNVRIEILAQFDLTNKIIYGVCNHDTVCYLADE